MRENHYAILVRFFEFPTLSNYKISITLLIFPKCLGPTKANPNAKLHKRVDIKNNTKIKWPENL